MSSNDGIQKWVDSADAWIADQGSDGDRSRRVILDPALERVLQHIEGKAVLDLGCGEGRYARKMKSRGAVVSGVDPVPKFVERARSLDPESNYIEASAENLPFADGAFDVVLSYLSFVDIPDLESAAHEIDRVLRERGQLVIVTLSNLASTTSTWVKDEDGRRIYRKVDRYMEHFFLDLEWRNIRIRNYHRPLSYVLGLFLGRGFVLTEFIEPLPDKSDPGYQEECRVPTFQIFCLDKRGGVS
ncbi:MAG: class I SAM-dependent methyltransferase [Planctomycetota bacterium]